ncbi:hypothetical protein [Gelidibacter maritimus]|uniref:Peptidylprolyl isomerase n=1 Tax=Gelidibacter maritimus TaxID=2761487 RepID=A0A7W2M899_9FLAO|nr:hypothetical protein [Gelidibacter maritimus]MBA6154472.1 hypothetical protein [Gelidibacter maritimus]
MKTLLTLLFVVATNFVLAQYPKASVTDINVKERADNITAQYNEHLGLTGVQIPLFKNKVAHYLVLADEIKRDHDGREELDALVEMQANETLAMNDILTLYQYRLYKKIKPEIQPLKMIE